MTCNTDRALALAVGWSQPDVMTYANGVVRVLDRDCWRIFDSMDWEVAGPIAARYNCFPARQCDGKWSVVHRARIYTASSPQEVIAQAVVGAASG